MSGLYEDLPFARGNTYAGSGNTPQVTPLAKQYWGKEYIVQDDQYGTGMFVTLRVCVNNSGMTLQACRAVKFNLVAGEGVGYDVAGYADVAGEHSAIIDDKLAPTGVADGDLFYVITRGPTMAYTTSVAGAGCNIAVGDLLQADTAATTGATTAGRLTEASFDGSTLGFVNQILGIVGRAMSARTTANTNSKILIQAGNLGNF